VIQRLFAHGADFARNQRVSYGRARSIGGDPGLRGSLIHATADLIAHLQRGFAMYQAQALLPKLELSIGIRSRSLD
jgi:hypothetical protein